MSSVIWTLASALVAVLSLAGAEFTNLDFENPDFTGGPVNGDGGFEVRQFLPGWTVLLGNSSNGVYVYFGVGIGDLVLGSIQSGANIPPLHGRYAVGLIRYDTNGPAYTLAQTGTIPAGSKFLTYACDVSYGMMELRINEEVLPRVGDLPIGVVATNLVYDVSKFAGKEVTLALVGPDAPTDWTYWPPRSSASTWIDNIRFVSAPPALSVQWVGSQVEVSWPASTIGLVLQSIDSSSFRAVWTTVPAIPAVVGDRRIVKLDVGSGPQFYRLGLE